MEIILIILFIYILILSNKKDIYEHFHPDERQFRTCPSPTGKGETNISVKESQPSPPLKGFFTSFLDITGEGSYDKYFKLHECPPNRKDISILDIQYENKIVDHDENIDTELTIDIFDTYSKPLGKTDNYSILYPDIFHDVFVEQYRKTIEADDRF